MSGYGITRELSLSFTEAIEKTKDALSEHGFGVLCEIDVAAKMREKLGVDFDDYVILGACNPENAYRALQEEQELGLLLPCNVIVYRDEGKTYVSAIKATEALAVAGNDSLQPVAETVENELKAVVESIEQ